MSSDEQHKVVFHHDTKSVGVEPVSTAIPPSGSGGSISWTAGEFIAHSKGPLWYVILIAVTIVLAGLIFLVTKDKTSTAVIVVVGLVLAIYGAKPPRELQYKVDSSGVQIGNKHYPFDRFRSFAIVQQASFSSLAFLPFKRFALLVTAYYDPQDEAKIIDIISSYLPLEEKPPDFLDKLMWKIKF